MTFQVLISTMNQVDFMLLDKMNIQSDAIVINQCDKDNIEEFEYKGYQIKWVNMSNRGIGISRNTALFYATADIVLFADDDVMYFDGYAEEISSVFINNLDADVVCFNINLVNSIKNFGYRNNKKCRRLNLFNSMRYGACRIAARRKTLLKNRISFSLLFGGGAEFSSGEDSLFIRDCYKNNMKLYANTYTLGQVDDAHSSWFKGIEDKFFIDRGVLLYSAFPYLHHVLFLYYAYRMRRMDNKYSFTKILKLFKQGRKIIKQYR